MAQENIIIDLLDENLVIQPDVYVVQAALDVTGTLVLTRTDGQIVTVDLIPLLSDIYKDIHVSSGTFNADTGQLVLSYNGDKEDISIDISNVDFVEYGGTNFDPLKGDYPVGHIVSIPDGSTYVCMVDPQTAQPGSDPIQWKPIGDEERGGILYDGTTTYHLGDMVSYNGEGYIAARESIGVAPEPGGNFDWLDMSLSEYYAGDFTPSLAQEYPDRTLETAGAYWMITNLQSPYIMTTGVFAGQEIGNGDRMLWNGTTWLFFPAPSFVEYGGIIYKPAHIYKKGDMVGYGPTTEPFVCTLDNTIGDGSQGPDNKTYWKAIASYEKGGVIWDPTFTYDAGDIVSEGNGAYVALAPSTGQTPSTSPLLWISLIPEESIEIGGVAWISNQTYRAGDVVSEGTKIYMRINSGGGSTTAPSGDPVYWKLLYTEEVGSSLWQPGTTYYEGDIVSWGDELYVAPPEGVAPGVQPPSAPWYDVSQEYGGTSYDPTLSYRIGDIVVSSVSGTLTMFISKIDSNLNSNPQGSPDEWEQVVSASVNEERGGTEWRETIDYLEGDITSLAKGSGSGYDLYIALIDNINVEPISSVNVTWAPLKFKERVGIEFVPVTSYLVGDIVSYNGTVYRAIEDNYDTAPGTDGSWYDIEAGSIPLNGIIMYDGSFAAIPSTFALCDGTMGTPDLRGLFILGAISEVDMGESGGSADAVVVSHSHSVSHEHGTVSSTSAGSHSHTANHDHPSATTSSTGSHSHTINHNHPVDNTSAAGNHNHTAQGDYYSLSTNPGSYNYGIQKNDGSQATSTSGSHTHKYSVEYHYGSSSSTGSHSHTLNIPNMNVTTSTIAGHVHSLTIPTSTVTSATTGTSGVGKNLPPYYKLAYIKRIA